MKKVVYYLAIILIATFSLNCIVKAETLNNVTQEIYIRTITTFDSLGNISDTFETKLNEEQYNSELSTAAAEAPCTGQFYNFCHQTEYKRLLVSYIKSNEDGKYYIHGRLIWDKDPVVKKYDIFAMRWSNSVNLDYLHGSQEAKGKAKVMYEGNDDNILYFPQAAGITMNMYDNTNEHVMIMEIGFVNNPGNVYITYQHARHSNITFAQSQSYTISPSGLGGVLYFSNSTVRSYYDGMQGIVADWYRQ